MSKITKKDRIAHLEFQVAWLTDAVHELQGTENLESEPQLKQLGQSVFDGSPDWAVSAAISPDGKAYVYSVTGDGFYGISDKYGYQINGSDRAKCIGGDYDTTDWQNSLIERDTAKELTGSDLARAMLERGDILVACKFSDYSEYKAIEQPVVTLIKEFNGTCFRNTNGSFYRYVVPINLATGEPLTQAEAGL